MTFALPGPVTTGRYTRLKRIAKRTVARIDSVHCAQLRRNGIADLVDVVAGRAGAVLQKPDMAVRVDQPRRYKRAWASSTSQPSAGRCCPTRRSSRY